tara:strand:- start:651 stop:1145 length:495 start_codon:yes stop_codon:yes gene_type:complete
MKKNIIIFSLLIISFTGCYKFKSPPFADKELTLISATEFGKGVFKAIGTVSPDKESPINELKESLSEDSKVLVINDEFLVMQNLKEGSWELTVLMKNSSHVMFCILLENKKIQATNAIKVIKKKEMMGVQSTVSGPSEELKNFALELIRTSGKLCFGVPYTTIR